LGLRAIWVGPLRRGSVSIHQRIVASARPNWGLRFVWPALCLFCHERHCFDVARGDPGTNWHWPILNDRHGEFAMAHVDELRDCAIRRLILAEEARASGDLDFAERLTALAIQYLDDANRIALAEIQAGDQACWVPEMREPHRNRPAAAEDQRS
jgi:hypothetical protein